MSFRVEPDALNGFSSQVDRAADYATEIKAYLDRHAEAGVGGEMFNIAKTAHEQTTDTVDRTLTRVAALLGESAPALTDAAAYYRRTDYAALASLDRFLPWQDACATTPLELQVAGNPCRYTTFADSHDVLAHLKPPGLAGTPANPLGWMDLISVSHWANEAIRVVIGVDPIGWVQQKIVGDWQAIAAMAPVVANVASALHATAYNVQTGAAHLHTVWDGNAADSAYQFFTRADNGIAGLQESLGDVSTEYRGLADAVWSLSEAIGTAVKALLDAAIIAGIAAAAGTVAIETGVGAVVGYGIAALEVARMLQLWGHVTSLVQKLMVVVLAFRGALAAKLATLDVVKLPALEGRYRHAALG